MLIPHRELSADALLGIIEDFVTRDGTDYGEAETPLATKVAQVRRQLDSGQCFIVYDPDLASVAIVPKEQMLPSALGAD
ncbi:MAG: YheU family protein [Candidatus Methylumidiphilus sp.]